MLIGIFILPRLLRRQETRIFSTVLPLAYLVLYSVGILFLVNASHQGGRLVHEYGVHAIPLATRSQPEPTPIAAASTKEDNRN